MAIAQQFLGDIGNVIVAATGVPIPLHRHGAVTFFTYEDDGSTIITLTQHTKTAAGLPDTESALAVIDRVHKGPGKKTLRYWRRISQPSSHRFSSVVSVPGFSGIRIKFEFVCMRS